MREEEVCLALGEGIDSDSKKRGGGRGEEKRGWTWNLEERMQSETAGEGTQLREGSFDPKQ